MVSNIREDLKALCRKHGIELIEDEWRSLNIDDAVMYQRRIGGDWYRGHFAGVCNLTTDDTKAFPCVFQDGKTAFSSSGISSSVRVCRRPFLDEHNADSGAE